MPISTHLNTESPTVPLSENDVLKKGSNSQVDTISHGEMSARDGFCPAKPPPDFNLPSCWRGYGGHPRRRRKKAACGIFRTTDVDARGPHNELIRNREEREGVSRKIMSDEIQIMIIRIANENCLSANVLYALLDSIS